MNKDKLISTLENENNDLKQQLKSIIEHENLRDEIVFQQSRMASMGEMISNIAHQWRQPLMEMSTLIMNLEAQVKVVGSISNDDILQTTEKSTNVIKYMSQTIEDFRNFFATNKSKETFFIAEQISTIINMMKSIFVSKNIKINIIIKNNLKVHGFKNEYSQVLMNILVNSKDAIVSNNIKNGEITIRLYKQDTNAILEIEDNGRGIDVTPISKVFEPFFTHQKKDGTGIGLFMSKLIIENNMNGQLLVSNKSEGACFTILLSTDNNK